MATRKSSKRQKTSGNSLDMSNYLNWPAGTLREKLSEVNISAASNFPISVLRKLYVDNVLGNASTDEIRTVPVVSTDNSVQSNLPSTNQQSPPSSTQFAEQPSSSSSLLLAEQASTDNTTLGIRTTYQNSATSGSQNPSTTDSSSPAVIESLVHTVQSLQTMVSSLTSLITTKETNLKSSPAFNLQEYYKSDVISHTSRKFGTHPEDLPQMELISNSLRKQILEGKDVNLASLLIPYYEIRESEKEKTEKEDSRLKRNLTIAEFLTAFGKYKRTMCQAFPNRRDELDHYEAIIVDLYNVYGERFYEYHKLFSLRSASALAVHKIKVDWSVRDRNLVQLIASRSKSCSICSEVSHDSKFCPQLQTSSVENSFQPTNIDRHGRKRTIHNGQEICNNFNSSKRCGRNNCPFLHVCSICKNKDHSFLTCNLKTKPKNAASSITNQK